MRALLPAAESGVHHHNSEECPLRPPPPIPTVRELAKAEWVNETYICRALRLTLLAPNTVEAILDGRQPEGVAVEWGSSGCSRLA